MKMGLKQELWKVMYHNLLKKLLREDVLLKQKILKILLCLVTAMLSVYYDWGIYAFFVLIGAMALIFSFLDDGSFFED